MKAVSPAASKREIRATFLGNCRALLSLPGAQFGFEDIKRAMGPHVAERQIRTALQRFVNSGKLVRPSRGRYVAGDELGSDAEAGTDLSNDLREAFYWAGGFMETPEILVATGREDDIGARLVRSALSESPVYEKSVPVDGFRNYWVVRDKERRNIPLRGCHHVLDLQLTLMHLADGHASWMYGLEKHLTRLRKRIGNALRDARMLFDIEPAAMVAKVARVFEKNLAAAAIPHNGASRLG